MSKEITSVHITRIDNGFLIKAYNRNCLTVAQISRSSTKGVSSVVRDLLNRDTPKKGK